MTETTTRERLAQMVVERPGLSASALARATDLDDTTVGYHLRRLARTGRVLKEGSGREPVWFAQAPGRRYCPVLRRAIPLLRRKGVRAFVGALADGPRSLVELAQASGLHSASARRAALSLEEIGLVARSAYGHVRRSDGADVCLAKALAGEPCGEWGRCAVSKALALRRQDAECDRACVRSLARQ